MKAIHKILIHLILSASLLIAGSLLFVPHNYPTVFHPAYWMLFLGIALFLNTLNEILDELLKRKDVTRRILCFWRRHKNVSMKT